MSLHLDGTTLLCTAGGTTAALLQTGPTFHPLETALNAALGAVVSFTIGAALKYLFRKRK